MTFQISRFHLMVAGVALVVGLAMLVALAYGYSDHRGFCVALGALVMTAAAAFAVGGLTGFVFAIPRVSDNGHRLVQRTNGEPEGEPQNGSVAPNSNLEQVSDWLTKILLGAGLTQINQIGGQLTDIGSQIEDATGVHDSVVPLVIVYFVVLGFVSLYIWTSTRFTGIVNDVHRQLQSVQSELSDVRDDFGEWKRAWSLVETQLSKESREGDTPVAELQAALEPLKSGDRAKIFYHARRVRSDNWQRNRKRMARTIPIFQALINLDEERKCHRNHAQIGYCLKDMVDSDYQRAIEYFDEAIRIRDEHNVGGWTVYEFNRALCWIELGLRQAGPPSAERQDAIIADLSKAMEFEDLPAMLDCPGLSAIDALRAQERVLEWCRRHADRVKGSPLAGILAGEEKSAPGSAKAPRQQAIAEAKRTQHRRRRDNGRGRRAPVADPRDVKSRSRGRAAR